MKQKAAFSLCVLPMVIFIVSLFILPKEIPLHFSLEGEVDLWGSKYYNLILCVFPWIFYAMIRYDLKNEGKNFLTYFLLIILFDILLCALTANAYAVCNGLTGKSINWLKLSFGLLGLVLIGIGAAGRFVKSAVPNASWVLYFLTGILLCCLTILVKPNLVYVILCLAVCLCAKVYAHFRT